MVRARRARWIHVERKLEGDLLHGASSLWSVYMSVLEEQIS